MGGIICKKPQVPDPELYVQDSFRSSLLTWTHGDIWVDYLKRETLGSGMSGSIFRILKKQTKEGFACKGVSKNTVRVDMIQDMMKEVALLKTLDHPNVCGWRRSSLDILAHSTRIFFCVSSTGHSPS